MAIDVKQAHEEFSHLKVQEAGRNTEYYYLRQAVKGNFRWPRDWPRHIPRVTQNLCRPITQRFVTYLMGKGFSYNIDRPNSLEFREAAERSEKILKRLLFLSKSQLQFTMGAKTGAELGRTVYKIYKKGKPGAEHACFTYCQPDYFYGIPASDDTLGDWSVVYYSYPLDIAEAKRRFGDKDYKSQREIGQEGTYEPLREHSERDYRLEDRRIPVLEVWTPTEYLLEVGGVVIFNGANPYLDKATKEGFIPFVVIENIRATAEAKGESDVSQARELNELFNYLISRKNHIVNRYLVPTLVWEGAPTNYADTIAQTQAGGGVIPARLGSRLSFLAYDRPNPAVVELEATLRAAILESAGMSEIALQGTTTGSVNTGPGLATQFTPALSTIEMKRQEWGYGLQDLFSKLLAVQEAIGDSKALGEAVINETERSQDFSDGDLVPLSGKDILGLREVVISWPGVLPKDDADSSRLEMEKAAQGLQSIYTTLEKLGVEYPADEIARIRMENQDPALRGDKVAEQMRAEGPYMKAQADVAGQMAEMQGGMEGGVDPYEAALEEELQPQDDTGIGAKLRALAGRRPFIEDDGEELSIGYPQDEVA